MNNKIIMVLITVAGLLSAGTVQAFQGLAPRLSLARPYNGASSKYMYLYPLSPNGTGRMSLRQDNKPVPFNILNYVRAGSEGLALAITFK